MDYEFNADAIAALSNRLIDLTAKEFDSTHDIGPANHFIAFAEFYKAFLIFFFRLSNGKDGVNEMIRVLHEHEEEAIKLSRELGSLQEKLN